MQEPTTGIQDAKGSAGFEIQLGYGTEDCLDGEILQSCLALDTRNQ